MNIKTVRNPYPLTDLWDGREIGDPFLMRHDGRFTCTAPAIATCRASSAGLARI